MKKNYIIAVLVLVVLALAGVTLYQSERIVAYQEYYEGAEELLDTLESHFNWVDGFDPYNYYEAVENLK